MMNDVPEDQYEYISVKQMRIVVDALELASSRGAFKIEEIADFALAFKMVKAFVVTAEANLAAQPPEPDQSKSDGTGTGINILGM